MCFDLQLLKIVGFVCQQNLLQNINTYITDLLFSPENGVSQINYIILKRKRH